MIQNDHFIIKTKVYFNKGSMQMLRCMKGHCALVVSDGIMQELGYLKMAQGYLKDAGINSAVFTGVKPDPDVNVVAAGVEAYESCNADPAGRFGWRQRDRHSKGDPVFCVGTA